MLCKFGHCVGMVATIEAIIALGRSEDSANVISMVVVLKERNKVMNRMTSLVMGPNQRVFRFENKDSLTARSCKTGSTSKHRASRGVGCLSVRIL